MIYPSSFRSIHFNTLCPQALLICDIRPIRHFSFHPCHSYCITLDIYAPESVSQVTMPAAADRVSLSRVAFNPSGLSVNYSHIHRALKWAWADVSHTALKGIIPQPCAGPLSIILEQISMLKVAHPEQQPHDQHKSPKAKQSTVKQTYMEGRRSWFE